MKWVFLFLAHVLAQPATPLLPTGVTIDMVKQINCNTGGVVAFEQSANGEATISNRLPFTPVISFDKTTGILSIDSNTANGSSLLKPGLVAAFLAVALCALNCNKQHQGMLLFLALGLGVASAGSVIADVTIRVPGCWHTEGVNGNTLLFDAVCVNTTTTDFQADPVPVAFLPPRAPWFPVTPNTSFLPARDHGQHYLTPEHQYEVWRSTFGRPYNETERRNFLDFTEGCRTHNIDDHRSWTAACNQFAYLSDADWQGQVLADNAAFLANFNAQIGRRLLSEAHDPFAALSTAHQRQLLQSTSFSWVGTGKLTPVKDQGQCGDCYAHSTSSQMEAHLSIVQGTVPVALSREQLKDCSRNFPGCNGGVPQYMYDYAAGTQGLGTEAALPHVQQNAACPSPLPAAAYKNVGYTTIANNELAFKTAVQKAPIAVTVCAGTWNKYAGGVFTNCASGCSVDHAVLLVGYGSDASLGNYWLIQNSWNTWWGESGFIRLPRTDSSSAGTGMCGLTTYAAYQANQPSGSSAGGTSTDCKGSWGAWSTCSVTCGGGTQQRTWTTTAQPTGGGAACPNPTTQSMSCNTNLCASAPTPAAASPTPRAVSPTPGTSPTPRPVSPTPAPAPSGTCFRLSNTVLGANADGNYNKATGWNQNFCGTASNPQYTATINGRARSLFWFTTNCVNNVRTAGQWGLMDNAGGSAYQWSSRAAVTNGVIPAPNTVGGWTIQFSACS